MRDKTEALAVLKAVLAGQGPAAMRDMLALNLGAALHLLEDGLSLSDGVARARRIVQAGVARNLADLGMAGHA